MSRGREKKSDYERSRFLPPSVLMKEAGFFPSWILIRSSSAPPGVLPRLLKCTRIVSIHPIAQLITFLHLFKIRNRKIGKEAGWVTKTVGESLWVERERRTKVCWRNTFKSSLEQSNPLRSSTPRRISHEALASSSFTTRA